MQPCCVFSPQTHRPLQDLNSEGFINYFLNCPRLKSPNARTDLSTIFLILPRMYLGTRPGWYQATLLFDTFSMFPISKLGGGYLDIHDKMARLDEQEAARKDGMREKIAFIRNRLSATDKTFQGDESKIWAKRVNGDDTIAARLEEGLIYFRGDIRDVEVDVLSRPWFRRLWVFQEAVVSRYLSIQCGSRRIGWDDFCGIVLRSLRLHDRYGLSLENLDRTDIVRDMCLARREHLRSCGLHHLLPYWQLSESSDGSIGALHVLKLLARARYLEASDPRDKIFGLLGIATGIDTPDPKFAVDYRLHYQQLYVDFARHFIETTSPYDIISYVDSTAESSLNCFDRSSNLGTIMGTKLEL